VFARHGPGFETRALTEHDDRAKKEKTMEHHTVLYICEQVDRNNPVLAAIKETGCEVVITDSPTEAIALLYILGQVAAVVLDARARKHAGFDVTQSLRRIRPGVPVMVQCRDKIDGSTSWTNSCVSTDELPRVLQHLLGEEAVN
jgi:CheY-like chemotaxis protein